MISASNYVALLVDCVALLVDYVALLVDYVALLVDWSKRIGGVNSTFRIILIFSLSEVEFQRALKFKYTFCFANWKVTFNLFVFETEHS